jgi:hypothetical protein
MSGYKTIAGVRYEKQLLQLAEHANSHGRIDEEVAQKLWASALDGPGVTSTERRTIEYIMGTFTLDGAARAYLEGKLQSLTVNKLPFETQRLVKLKEIFKSMDKDGNGSVDLAEFRAATSNATMMKLFSYMDNNGDRNGSLSMDEWLGTMTKVGLAMDDASFERDLVSMLNGNSTSECAQHDAHGVEAMSRLSCVAERVNHLFFQQLPVGSVVRVGGRFASTAQLTTTDGGMLALSNIGAKVSDQSGFVEVVGTKTEKGALDVVGVVALGKEVDAELWDEAVKMSHHPQLREIFAPMAAIGA